MRGIWGGHVWMGHEGGGLLDQHDGMCDWFVWSEVQVGALVSRTVDWQCDARGQSVGAWIRDDTRMTPGDDTGG